MTFARQSLGSLLALVFGVVASVLLARALGAEARGEYQVVVKTAGLVLAVAQWGIPEVLLQLVDPGTPGGERAPRLASLTGTAMLLGLGGCVAAGGLLAALLPLLQASVLQDVDLALVLVALAGSALAIVGILGRRLIQLAGHVDLYNGLDVGRTALFLGLAAAFVALLPREAVAALGAWFLAELALAVAVLAYLWRAGLASWRFDPRLARRLVVAGVPIQVGLVALYLGAEGGIYVLNASLSVAAVGVYAVATSLARLVLQVSMALRTALQPRLVVPGADSAAVTARVTRHGGLWMLLVAAAVAAGSPLVPVVFGPEFASAGWVTLLLLPGMLAFGVQQLLAGYLLRVGQRGILAASAWVFAAASVALQLLGARLGGLEGAAAGLSLAYVAGAAIVVVAFSRASGWSIRHLLPGPADLGFYADLTRRLVAARGAARPAAGRL